MDSIAEKIYWAKNKCQRFSEYIETLDGGIPASDADALEIAFISDRDIADQDLDTLLMRIGIVERALQHKGLK